MLISCNWWNACLVTDGYNSRDPEGQPLTLRRHAGYDHGYYFIASFVEDHLRHHARALLG